MARRRGDLKVVMLAADAEHTVDSDQIADGVVEHLKTNHVTRWVAEVQAAIAAARNCSTTTPTRTEDPRQREKERLKAQIGELTRKLEELGSE